jgi:hypothetical protein
MTVCQSLEMAQRFPCTDPLLAISFSEKEENANRTTELYRTAHIIQKFFPLTSIPHSLQSIPPMMKTATTLNHFVFGYGSLICPESRAITAPEQSHKIATPVSVKNVERVWSKRTARGMTAMGVRFVEDAACIGVILPVSDKELALFDEREQGYDRKALLLSDVEQVF